MLFARRAQRKRRGGCGDDHGLVANISMPYVGRAALVVGNDFTSSDGC